MEVLSNLYHADYHGWPSLNSETCSGIGTPGRFFGSGSGMPTCWIIGMKKEKREREGERGGGKRRGEGGREEKRKEAREKRERSPFGTTSIPVLTIQF